MRSPGTPDRSGLFIVGSLTAGITAFYAFRLLGIAFFGQRSAHLAESEAAGHEIREPGPLSLAPYIVLASATVVLGLLALFGLESSLASAANSYLGSLFTQGFTAGLTSPAPSFELIPALLTLAVVAVGVAAAAQLYVLRRSSAADLVGGSATLRGMQQFLENRWYLNAVYYRLFVDVPLKSANWLAVHFEAGVLQKVNTGGEALGLGLAGAGVWFDRNVIDAIVGGFSAGGQSLSRHFRRMQTGVVESYALVLLLGLVALLVLLIVITGLNTGI